MVVKTDLIEDARLRLRYDHLSVTHQQLRNNQPANRQSKNPTDGLTRLMEATMGSGRLSNQKNCPLPPGGVIGVKARAMWRRCVRDRENMSQAEWRRQRKNDIDTVRQWATGKQLVMADVMDYYGLPFFQPAKSEDNKPDGFASSRTLGDLDTPLPLRNKRRRANYNDEDDDDDDEDDSPESQRVKREDPGIMDRTQLEVIRASSPSSSRPSFTSEPLPVFPPELPDPKSEDQEDHISLQNSENNDTKDSTLITSSSPLPLGTRESSPVHAVPHIEPRMPEIQQDEEVKMEGVEVQGTVLHLADDAKPSDTSHASDPTNISAVSNGVEERVIHHQAMVTTSPPSLAPNTSTNTSHPLGRPSASMPTTNAASAEDANSWRTLDDTAAAQINQCENATEEAADAARKLVIFLLEHELRFPSGGPSTSLGHGRWPALFPWTFIHDVAMKIQMGTISNGFEEKQKAGQVLAERFRRRLLYLKDNM